MERLYFVWLAVSGFVACFCTVFELVVIIGILMSDNNLYTKVYPKVPGQCYNTQDACSSRVSCKGVLRWCLVIQCAEWRGWMWKCLIVARVFVCVLHQPSAIF